MKHYEQKMVAKTIITRATCDKCGVDVKLDTYEHYEVEITPSEYEPYEVMNSRDAKMDLCRPCAKNLKALIAAAGYEMNDNDWSTEA